MLIEVTFTFHLSSDGEKVGAFLNDSFFCRILTHPQGMVNHILLSTTMPVPEYGSMEGRWNSL